MLSELIIRPIIFGESHSEAAVIRTASPKRKYNPESLACLSVTTFAVSPSNDDLHTNAEAQAEHKDYHIVNSGQGRSPNFNLSNSAEKSSIGHTDQLLHHKTDKYRIGYLPDSSV